MTTTTTRAKGGLFAMTEEEEARMFKLLWGRTTREKCVEVKRGKFQEVLNIYVPDAYVLIKI